MLRTPSQAAQVRAWLVLWAMKTILTTEQMMKYIVFTAATETAVRYVGGRYSECNNSDGLGM